MAEAAGERTRYDYRHWPAVRAMLLAHPNWVQNDGELLSALDLRPAAANVVEFGPAALARLESAKAAERTAREEIEALAEANYAAQTASHAAVVDFLAATSASDLALRVDAAARDRFGLVAASLAIEHSAPPAGWRILTRGLVDQLLHGRDTRFGPPIAMDSLFGVTPGIRSVALVRMRLWPDATPDRCRTALLAFGAADPAGFTADMGGELVAFLARVVAQTAERWPTKG